MASNSGFQRIGDILNTALFRKYDRSYHVPAADRDFIDTDSYLCCGQCRARKEFRRFEPGHDLGFVQPCLCECGKQARDREEAARRDSEKRTRIDELIRYGSSDAQFRRNRFENCVSDARNEKAVAIARRYAQKFEQLEKEPVGLLFYGPVGTGKTFLADCIANDLMDRGIPVFATSIIKLAAAPDLQETIAVMKNARLLILDDFGAERDSSFMQEKVFLIFDEWFSQLKPIIVTTNYADFNDVRDIRMQRVFDRIAGVCKPVAMNGESRRRHIGAERFKHI